jgi:N-acetylmuramoyl-L-alanine amidase
VSRKLPKEISRLLFIAALLTVFLPCTADALTIKTTRKLVVLDPGHGGTDPGITSTTGILEKQIVLKLARMTAEQLSDQYQSLLTRTSDIPLSGADRAAFANQNRADLFLSLHLHAKQNKSFFFYFDTPDTLPAKNSTQWRTQGLLHQPKSRQAAALFAKIFQDLDKEAIPHAGPAPAIPLEGLQMPAILTEPFTLSDIPVTASDQQEFLFPYAKKLARCIEAYFGNNF